MLSKSNSSSARSASHSGGGSPLASLTCFLAFRLAVLVAFGWAITLARCASASAIS